MQYDSPTEGQRSILPKNMGGLGRQRETAMLARLPSLGGLCAPRTLAGRRLAPPGLRACAVLVLVATWAIIGCQSGAGLPVADGDTAGADTNGPPVESGTDAGLDLPSDADLDDVLALYRIYARLMGPGQWHFQVARQDGQPVEELDIVWDVGAGIGASLEGFVQDVEFLQAGRFVVTATALDADGRALHTWTLEIDNPEGALRAPQAKAGSDQIASPGQYVCLDGSASSDPNDDSLTYTWRQCGGAAVSVIPDQADPAVACFTAPPPTAATEELRFCLTVDDGELTASDTVLVVVTAPRPPSDHPSAEPSPSLHEDFEEYTPGEDPPGWLDTDADGSLVPNDTLFKVVAVDGDNALGTTSSLTNIHSHEVGAQGSSTWTTYTFSGRMMFDDADGGIGLTFLSGYPDHDRYYRLRRGSFTGGKSFHIAPWGTEITGGHTDTDVVPVRNHWYQFEIEVEDTGSRTEIRARVWRMDGTKPTEWQVDCHDDSTTRLRRGTVGVWSMGPGDKYWDDISVVVLHSSSNPTCATDTDGDGTVDCNDACMDDPGKTDSGECGCGVPDDDVDGDAVADCHDGCPDDAAKDAPGACGCGVPDVDGDGDGSADCIDGCPADENKTSPGACGCGVPDEDANNDGSLDCADPCVDGPDSDGDGTPNCADGCPNDPNKIAPGACGCGVADTDSDGDSRPNCTDGCPNDPTKTVPGACGCGVPDTDTDQDGTPNCNDRCPLDPAKTAPGACGCGVADSDSDGDGSPNCTDGCPNDPNKTAPGVCGCGVVDTDSDHDGTANCHDDCPNDPGKTSPGVCGCGVPDTDSDDDGTPDCEEPPPTGGPMSTASHSSGMAPLAVFFDTVPSSSGVVQPAGGDYGASQYSWNFGDPGSGAWSTTGLSKNTATGFCAAHVYENPGTYTATLEVRTSAGATHVYTQNITVTAFSGTTYYVAAAGNDSNDGRSPAAPFRTFAKGMSQAGPNTRILFKRGDTWTISAGHSVNVAGPGIIGAYYQSNGSDDPSRPKPTIRMTSDESVLRFHTQGTNWRVMDLHLDGPSAASNGNGVSADTAVTRNLLLRMDIEGFQYSIAQISNTTLHDEHFVVDSYLHDAAARTMWTGSSRLVILGNLIEHSNVSIVRCWYCGKGVISQNVIDNPGNMSLKLHAEYPSSYIVITDNDFDGADGAASDWPCAIAPQNATSDERIEDVLVERNVFRAHGSTQVGLFIAARDITVRNNLFLGTGGSVWYSAIAITKHGIEPAPRNVHVYNNTAYRADDATNFRFCVVGAAAQSTAVRNNLAVAPAGGPPVLIDGGGSGLIQSNNLALTQGGFVNAGAGNFRLTSSSPARNAGTALSEVREDFARQPRPMGNSQDVGAYEYAE